MQRRRHAVCGATILIRRWIYGLNHRRIISDSRALLPPTETYACLFADNCARLSRFLSSLAIGYSPVLSPRTCARHAPVARLPLSPASSRAYFLRLTSGFIRSWRKGTSYSTEKSAAANIESVERAEISYSFVLANRCRRLAYVRVTDHLILRDICRDSAVKYENGT